MRKHLVLVAMAMAIGSPAWAAGIDSRIYSCAQLQSLVGAQGFVFISQATFGDFVVANASFCGGDDRLQTRSVATADNPSARSTTARPAPPAATTEPAAVSAAASAPA